MQIIAPGVIGKVAVCICQKGKDPRFKYEKEENIK
jgi:hypothetical protein